MKKMLLLLVASFCLALTSRGQIELFVRADSTYIGDTAYVCDSTHLSFETNAFPVTVTWQTGDTGLVFPNLVDTTGFYSVTMNWIGHGPTVRTVYIVVNHHYDETTSPISVTRIGRGVCDGDTAIVHITGVSDIAWIYDDAMGHHVDTESFAVLTHNLFVSALISVPGCPIATASAFVNFATISHVDSIMFGIFPLPFASSSVMIFPQDSVTLCKDHHKGLVEYFYDNSGKGMLTSWVDATQYTIWNTGDTFWTEPSVTGWYVARTFMATSSGITCPVARQDSVYIAIVQPDTTRTDSFSVAISTSVAWSTTTPHTDTTAIFGGTRLLLSHHAITNTLHMRDTTFRNEFDTLVKNHCTDSILYHGHSVSSVHTYGFVLDTTDVPTSDTISCRSLGYLSTPHIFCEGAATIFFAPTAPGFSYLWNDGSTEDALFIDSTQRATVRVTDRFGCISVLTDTFTFLPSPVITFVSPSTPLGCGDSVILHATMTMPGTIYWVWLDTSRRYDDRDSGDYFVARRPATYRVEAQASNGCSATTDTVVPYVIVTPLIVWYDTTIVVGLHMMSYDTVLVDTVSSFNIATVISGGDYLITTDSFLRKSYLIYSILDTSSMTTIISSCGDTIHIPYHSIDTMHICPYVHDSNTSRSVYVPCPTDTLPSRYDTMVITSITDSAIVSAGLDSFYYENGRVLANKYWKIRTTQYDTAYIHDSTSSYYNSCDNVFLGDTIFHLGRDGISILFKDSAIVYVYDTCLFTQYADTTHTIIYDTVAFSIPIVDTQTRIQYVGLDTFISREQVTVSQFKGVKKFRTTRTFYMFGCYGDTLAHVPYISDSTVINIFTVTTRVHIGDTVLLHHEKVPGRIKIYPNPSTDIVTVEMPGLFSARLRTIDGRTITTISGVDKVQFDFSDLSKAVYFISLFNQDGLEWDERVVKE